MTHHDYKELLQLSLYDELDDAEQSALESHVRTCTECRHEREELRKLHDVLMLADGPAPDDRLLSDARQNLRSFVLAERRRVSAAGRLRDVVRGFILPHYKVAFGGVVLLAAGLFLGRLTVTSPQHSAEQPRLATTLEGEPRISNIRFIDSDASDGNVEFTFDATSPVHIMGSINDERVQKVLAHALVNDQNPGVRLRSVNAFAAQAEKLLQPDRDVKAALILAVKTDNNPAVRKEALRALRSFPFDEEIKQTFLHVLMRDTNPALRIAAVNGLDSSRAQGTNADKEVLDVLKQRLHADENSYVRIRAKTVLEEVKQQ